MKITRRIKNYFLLLRRTAAQSGLTKYEKIPVILDIIYCRIRFGCSCKDYAQYQFYKYKNNYRKYFIANHHKKIIVAYSNPTGELHNKYDDYQLLKSEISRQILLIPDCGEETFLSFLQKHRKVVVKPCNSRAGNGLEILKYSTDDDARKFFSSLTDPMLCEEYVCQHSVIAALNPSSLNTIRIVTLLDNDQFVILSAALKMGGSADSIADNMHRNGIAASIHLDSGIISTLGRDYANHTYTHHPVSGTQIIGIQIPHWEKVKETVHRAHIKMSPRPYIGWDVAITETGVEIIEANTMPGHITMQFFDQIPKGKLVFQFAKQRRRRKKTN